MTETQTVTIEVDGAAVSASALVELRGQLSGVLEAFRPFAAEFRDGFSLQLGWGPFLLRADGPGRYTVVSPDYSVNSGDEVTDDLSVALWVLVGQLSVLSRASIDEPVPTAFDDAVIVSKRALNAPRWAMTRTNPTPGDSGWYIDVYPTPPGDSALSASEMVRYTAADLLRYNDSAVRALLLPPGIAAVVSEDSVDVVFRESDVTILAQGPL
jgi:hypothetical protein